MIRFGQSQAGTHTAAQIKYLAHDSAKTCGI